MFRVRNIRCSWSTAGSQTLLGRCALLAFLLATLTVVVAGCSLPGYSTNPVQSGHWYSFDNDQATYKVVKEEPNSDHYNVQLINITPALIAKQRRQKASEKLSPAQQALTAPEKARPYYIGPGDVLRIIVYGQSDWNNPSGNTGDLKLNGQLVNASGNIYYPFAGVLHVAGKTPPEVRRELTRKLRSVIRKPQVDVRVIDYQSKRVYVSGDISKPCAVPLTDTVNTVLQVLDNCDTLSGREGGVGQQGAGVQNVVLIRNGQSTFLDLNQIYAAGNPVPLQPGDRLLVDDSANRVFMMGEFAEQKALPFSTGGMSLNDALGDTGGLRLDTANPGSVYVIRGFIKGQSVADGELRTAKRPKVFKLDMSHVGGMLLANEFQLRPRDIVFAPPASLVNFNRALSLITPSLNILLQSALLYERTQH